MEQPVIAHHKMPARVPVRPQGHVEVIARLLLVASDVARCVRPRDPWPAGPVQPGRPVPD